MEKEPVHLWFLRVFPRIFLTIIVPFYGGYVGASVLNMFGYVLVAGAASLYFFASNPSPRQLMQQGGTMGLLRG
jgi:hypothetical protein